MEHTVTLDGRTFRPSGESTEPDTLDCGHVRTPRGIAYGTAGTVDGRTICLDCAEREELDAFGRPETQTAVGYVNLTDRTITTWTGVTLARIVEYRSSLRWGALMMWRQTYVRTKDAYGRTWWGRGSDQYEAITLHRRKR